MFLKLFSLLFLRSSNLTFDVFFYKVCSLEGEMSCNFHKHAEIMEIAKGSGKIVQFYFPRF